MTTTAPNSSTRKRNKWGRIWLCALLLTFALLIGLSIWLTVAGNPEKQFRISPETTVLTEPLTNDGLVDYAEAIRRRNREEVPPNQNAARLLLEAIGPQAFDNDEQARQAYEQLDMEPLPEAEDGRYLAYLRDVADAMAGESPPDLERSLFISEDQLRHCMRAPWSAADAPEIAEWIALNGALLEKLHAASLLPHYRAPIIESSDRILMVMIMPTVNPPREFARLLTARAMQRVDTGDVKGAWADIHCVHRLASLYSQGYSQHEYQVACAFSSMATSAMSALLASPEMTLELLQSIRDDCEQMWEWRDFSEIIDTTERYVILDVIQQCTRDGAHLFNVLEGLWFGDFELPEHPAMNHALNATIDWDSILVRANEVCDRLVIAFQEPDHERRAILLKRIDEQQAQFRRDVFASPFLWSNPTRNIGGRTLAYLWPSMEHAHEMLLLRDARFLLIDTALAIEQFRFDHGHLPGSLAELVPQYLDEVPIDPCPPCDELHYLTHPNDAYVLYSVGHDGVDNGGTSERDDVIFQVRMPVPKIPRFEESTSAPTSDPLASSLAQ